jgi:hypothetical protein
MIVSSLSQMIPTVNKFLLLVLVLLAATALRAQKVDSIYFHLYTDSLKKGQHNYINVDGKMSNGQWKPLTEKDIKFTSSSCRFSGNELIIPFNCSEEKITVKAELKSNPALWIERTIWIKKLPDPDKLPTNEEVLREYKKPRKRR